MPDPMAPSTCASRRESRLAAFRKRRRPPSILPNGRTFTAPSTNSSNTADVAPTPVLTTDPQSNVIFFAGLTDDPFFFDIPAFGRFNASIRAGAPNPGVFSRGRDTFAGYNTMAIALSMPLTLVRGPR